MRAIPSKPVAVRAANAVILVGLWALILVGCTSVSPTNPWDPSTPAAQQAKGVVHGAVALPPGYAPARFEGAGVDLFAGNDAVKPVQQGSLLVEAPGDVGAGDAGAGEAAVVARFTFEGLAAGRYLVRPHVEGFEVPSADFDVAIGGVADVGTLQAQVAGTSAVEGTATLDPAPPEGHAGITVEVANSPVTALTNSDGRYRVALGSGTYTLRFSAPGYEGATLAEQRVEAGQTVVAAAVVLHGRPGGIDGLVRLDPLFGTPELLGQVSVHVRSLGEVGEAGELAAQTPTPLAEDPLRGSFAFDDLAPGNYVVDAVLPGFGAVSRPATVRLGERANVGDLVLTADLEGQGATLTGFVKLACAGDCDHGGIRVEAADKPFVTFTNAAGEFRLEVVAGRYDLKFSSPGYVSQTEGSFSLEVDDVLPVSTADAPFVLAFQPAAVTGRVLRTSADGTLVAASGAGVVLADVSNAERIVGQTNADAQGGFRLDGFAGGAYTLTATLPGHEPAVRPAATRNGETLAAGELVLALDRGAIAGTVSLSGAEGRGGATIRVTRRAAVGDEAVLRTTLASAPDDRFALAGLPVGTYDLVALAEGFRPVTRDALVVEAGGTLEVSAALAARVSRLSVPAGARTSPVSVHLEGDADLTFARRWLDTPEPPADLDFEPLPGDGRLDVALPAEGPHVVYAQLATAAHVAPAPETAHLRAVSPVLQAGVVLDTRAPTLSVVHLPAGAALPGFVRSGEVANLALSAFEPSPGSGLDTVRVQTDGAAAVPQPYAPRLGVPALPAGDHTLTLTAVDVAGNAGPPATVDLRVDAAAPEGLLEADQPLITRAAAVFLRITASDADGSPLEYRVFEAGSPSGVFLPFPPGPGDAFEASAIVALRPGEGERRVGGEVRDAAGRVTALGEVAFTVDTLAAAPTSLTVTDAQGGPIPAGARVRLTPVGEAYTVDVQVAVDGAAEPLTVRLVGRPETCALDPRAGPTCTLRGVPLDVLPGGIQAVRFSAYTEDAAGNRSATVDVSFTVDLDGPRELSLALPASGRTRETELDVALNARGAVSYAVAGAGVQAVAETPAVFPVVRRLVLTPGDGPKAISVTFRDDAGNTAQIAGSVTLDRTPPVFGVTLKQGGAALVGDPPRIGQPVVTVSIAPTLEVDCPALDACALEKRVSLVADFGDAAFGPFTTDTLVALPAVDGVYDLFVQVRDRAGNVAGLQANVRLEVALDQVGPPLPGLRRTYIGADKIRLELTAPAAADLSHYLVQRNRPDLDGAWTTAVLHPAVADDLGPAETNACAVQTAGCVDGAAAGCLRAGATRGGVVLLEDRDVTPGSVHLYRAQAYDTLGNASGFTSTVDAGVPLAPPTFSVFDVGASGGGAGGRNLRWHTSVGTFFLDYARYARLDELGRTASTTGARLDSGAYALPAPGGLLGQNQAASLLPEEFQMQVANVDRSVMWRSAARGPEVARRALFVGAEGLGPVAAVTDAVGAVYALTTDRDRHLLLVRTEADGTTTEFRDLLPGFHTSAVLHAIQTAAGNLLALTFDEDSGALRLVDFTDPWVPVRRELADVCPNACPDVRVSGQVVVEGATTHVAFVHPVTRKVNYDSFGAEVPAFAAVDNLPANADRDVRLFVSGGAVSLIEAQQQAPGLVRLVFLASGRPWTTTVLRDNISVSDGDIAALMDAQRVGNTYHLVWSGTRSAGIGSVYRFAHYASFAAPAAIANPVVLYDSQSGGSDDVALRSPIVLTRPNGQQLMWGAASVLGHQAIYLIQEAGGDGIFLPVTVGEVIAGDDRGPHVSAVLDRAGRSRAYVRDTASALTEFTVTPRLASEMSELRGRSATVGGTAVDRLEGLSAVVTGGRVLGDLTDLPPMMAVGRAGHGLFAFGPDDAVRTVENAANRWVGAGTAIANRGINTFALYTASPSNAAGAQTDLFLRQVNGAAPPAAVLLDSNTGFANYASQRRSELRLLTTADGTMHSAWYRTTNNTPELVYWRRTSADVVTTSVFRAGVFNNLPAVPPLGAGRLGGATGMKTESIVTVKTPRGIEVVFVSGGVIHALDVTTPATASLRSMDLDAADAVLLDAAYGEGGSLHVAFERGGRLYLSAFGGTPAEACVSFNPRIDAARIVTDSAGETGVVYSETITDPAHLATSVSLLLARPLQGEPLLVLSPAQGSDGSLRGLSVFEDGAEGFDVFTGGAEALPVANGGQLGLVSRVRVRRFPELVVSHTRVDGLRPLGAPTDRDEDGRLDAADLCPEVFDPGQADADRDGIGDACELVCL